MGNEKRKTITVLAASVVALCLAVTGLIVPASAQPIGIEPDAGIDVPELQVMAERVRVYQTDFAAIPGEVVVALSARRNETDAAAARVDFVYNENRILATDCAVVTVFAACSVDQPGLISIEFLRPEANWADDDLAHLIDVTFSLLDVNPGEVWEIEPIVGDAYVEGAEALAAADIRPHNGAVQAYIRGDVNCDTVIDGADALWIALDHIGAKEAVDRCPLANPGQIVRPAGDLNFDNQVRVTDAHLAMLCYLDVEVDQVCAGP